MKIFRQKLDIRDEKGAIFEKINQYCFETSIPVQIFSNIVFIGFQFFSSNISNCDLENEIISFQNRFQKWKSLMMIRKKLL